jgi:hypothetical protein
MPRFIIVTILATIAVAFAACADSENETTPTPSLSPSPSASPTPSSSPSPSPTTFPDVCLPNRDPATSEFQIIEAPAPLTEVTSPVTVSGQVNAFEGTYQIAIFDTDGTPLVETFGTAQQPDMGVIGPFSSDVTFTVTEPTPACIWVFEQSARDGSPIHIGQIPVVLLP